MIQADISHPLHTASGRGKLELAFQLHHGELLALSGPSGGGKTTLLRILAGLLVPQQGKIQFQDQLWLDTSARIRLRPQERQVGMVFQDYALFPHMTVAQNLRYALPKGGPTPSSMSWCERSNSKNYSIAIRNSSPEGSNSG
ncbi:MAG: ATP-binding cassette domain-containing protein [Haliscomenobacter sp.]|nr:ATP-binding cassette domain-containing protein [Haliscomenobacter sp.]